MKRRALQVEQALDLLPDMDDLLPLREALIGGSAPRADSAWAGSADYPLLDTRIANSAAVEAALPELLQRIHERTETVLRGVLAAVRAAENGDLAGAARSLVAAGEAEEAVGRLNAAERLYGRAAEVGRRPRDRQAEGLALRRLGRVARLRGRLHESRALYARGFDVAEAQRDEEGMIVACQGLGNVLVEQGRWSEAESWYLRGLQLVGSEEPSRHLWQFQSNLSAVSRRAGRLEDSARWLAEARDTVETLGDAGGRAYVLNAEGMLRAASRDFAGAEAAYGDALQHSQTTAETARILVNLSEALVKQEKISEADQTLRRLEQIALAQGLLVSLLYAYRGLGEVAGAQRDENGFVFYEQALELCREERLPQFEAAITQREYGRFEAKFGKTESAVARLEEAARLFEELGAELDLSLVEEEIGRVIGQNESRQEKQ